ncbi:interferon-inducible GTPase 5-like [Eublepharis macularius]|uniref:Interferon-inducible GTPase 5-like n=1 Tax=Eublepharis macularius TaxID=481883 RepID=A0AA97LGC6_EUBMA|nr:interferon-inducible GTPase 5-like [Eublepharis macularius]XP_054855078.1 interferon-inducible GTPase 5-like [Eublepharis macularius]
MAMEEFQAAVFQGKLTDAVSVVLAKPLQYFNSTTLNIAVVGEPGSGKSSFVNSLLGLRAGEPGAAETGIQTTTTKAKDYPHPRLQQVILWDLPGKEDSPLGARVEQEDLNRYDFFFIIAYQRFRTVHADLAQEIQAMGKRFYFVRAKTDLDLEASRRRQPSGCDEEKVLHRIREDCITSLQNENVSNPQVFLVSNWDPQCFDFPLLREKLQNDLPWLKRQAFMFHLPSLSAPVLESKKAALKRKIRLSVFCSGLFALLPLPGFSFVVAMFVFMKFRSRCYRDFGLDDLSLEALARHVGKPVAILQAVMTSRALTPVILGRLPDLVGAVLMIVECFWWNQYPIRGSLASGGISVFASHYMLQRCISTVAKDTQNVLSKALEVKEKNLV